MEDVNVSGSIDILGTVDTCTRIDHPIEICVPTILLNTKKPYVLYESNIECVVGEWNKDKGEYGVRVYFVSGNNNWFGGDVARDLLSHLSVSQAVVEKFDKRVKAGPPSV